MLRGMHDHGADDIYVIVTDLKRNEMDQVTEYFKLVCKHSFGRPCKPSMEAYIQHLRLSILPIPRLLFCSILGRFKLVSDGFEGQSKSVLPPIRSYLPSNPER